MDKVLVVEDSRAYRNFLASRLKALGVEVVLADTVARAEQILATGQSFLCAVLDYCLPDGEDGEVIDLALSYKLKVIVLTANFSEELRSNLLGKGVLDYILKESMASVSYLMPLVKRLSANRRHKALVVDDSRAVRNYVVQLLNNQLIETLEADNGQQGLDMLNSNPDVSLVITDHDMPVKDGISMLRELRQKHNRNDVSVLGVSGSADKTMTARFLKAGANDFLLKPFNQEEFNCRVQNLLDMKEANNDLYKAANQDPLTGLWNRRYFFSQPKSKSPICVAMMDIDFFKKVNDTYGHDGGDEVLAHVANLINDQFKGDVVARFGGEEFCVKSTLPYAQFLEQLEQLRSAIESSVIHHQGEQIKVTISIGATNVNATIDEMIKAADTYLYDAKQGGRNQVVADKP